MYACKKRMIDKMPYPSALKDGFGEPGVLPLSVQTVSLLLPSAHPKLPISRVEMHPPSLASTSCDAYPLDVRMVPKSSSGSSCLICCSKDR